MGLSHYWKFNTIPAFTLAEVLITLGIIGVVAAMTLPTLVQNHKKQTIETRLAKFYSTINQAIAQSEVENGSRMYWTQMEDRNANNVVSREGITPKEWYEKYLKKYLKVLKVEDSNTIEKRFDIYFTDGSLVTFSGSGWGFYPFAKNYKKIKRENADGTSYNDLNRETGGRELFSFMFSPTEKDNKYLYKKGVEPYTSTSWDGTIEDLKNNPMIGCNKYASNTAANCTKLIQLNGWKIPADYPFKL